MWLIDAAADFWRTMSDKEARFDNYDNDYEAVNIAARKLEKRLQAVEGKATTANNRIGELKNEVDDKKKTILKLNQKITDMKGYKEEVGRLKKELKEYSKLKIYFPDKTASPKNERGLIL